MPVAFEGREKNRDQRLEPLAADAVSRVPPDDENLAHRLVVKAQSRGSHGRNHCGVVVQDAD